MSRAFILAVFLLFPAMLMGAESDYQRWKRESLQGYQRYRSEQDQAFASYLEKQWQEFRLFKGEKRDPVPKPKAPPVLVKPGSMELPAEKKKLPIAPPLPLTPVIPAVTVRPAPRELPPVTTPAAADTFEMDFFGHLLTLTNNHLPPFDDKVKPTNLSISAWWQSASGGDHQRQLDALKKTSTELQLSDWGTYLLVRKYALSTHPKSRNEQVITQWFILTRLGFATKIAYHAGDLVLLLQTRQPLYETMYLTYGENRYYIMDAPPEMDSKLISYDGSHPQAQNVMSMEQNLRLFDTQSANMERSLSFSYSGKQYHLRVSFSKQTIDFLSTVPPTELSVYFNAPESSVLRKQLVEQLRPIVSAISKEQAVNLLLAFVQKSFDYATDEQQFGHEHYMFADELFFYPSSDCEDRAVLFTHLVRELLGLDVVGLSYEGHVATAVALRDVKGRTVNYRNRDYLVADPTYINAGIGMEMPQYRGSTPQIIETR